MSGSGAWLGGCSLAQSSLCFLEGESVISVVSLPLQVGPHICVFKTHVDVFDSWSPDTAKKLQALAEKHGGGRQLGSGGGAVSGLQPVVAGPG